MEFPWKPRLGCPITGTERNLHRYAVGEPQEDQMPY